MGAKFKGFFELLVELSGLDRARVEEDFRHLFEEMGVNPETMDLDELRGLMLRYLEEQMSTPLSDVQSADVAGLGYGEILETAQA